MKNIHELEPNAVFKYFAEICSIPHGSGNIQAISDYLCSFAQEHALEHYQDEIGNVVMFKQATAGYEETPGIIIQGHMDMVAAVETGFEDQIDMTTDGLKLMISGDDLYAEHTTLGGDDGIAVAYGLALMAADDIPHPALEFIVTVDEEVGMDGAAALAPELIRYKRLINIDNEVEGQIIAGCAGGGRVIIELPIEEDNCIKAKEQSKLHLINISVGGCIGGHSGVEIHRGRANTNIIAGRLLYEIINKCNGEIYLTSIAGGTADNAIPPLTSVCIAVNANEVSPDSIVELVKEQEQIIKAEYAAVDPNMSFTITDNSLIDGDRDIKLISFADTKRLINLLMTVPNGIMAMSADVPGLVETSLNLGIVESVDGNVRLHFSVRSSVGTAKQALIDRLNAIGDLAGAKVDVSGIYPGWQYRVDSPLRDLCAKVYEQMYGLKPVVEAIHAGLECGFFLDKDSEIDCVSIGPNIYDIHTPRERLSIESTKRVWEYLCEVLKS